MGFLAVAVVAGLGVALLLGGRPRHLTDRTFRWTPLLVAGVALQVAANFSDTGFFGTAAVLASYACLMAFAAANLALVGMGVVLIGIALNFAVIAANGGMPVSREAILSIDPNEDLSAIEDDNKHHLERPDDRLMFLADIIPVRPLGEAISFGDLILAFGVADLMVHLFRPSRRKALPTLVLERLGGERGGGA